MPGTPPDQIRAIFSNFEFDGRGDEQKRAAFYKLLRELEPHLVGRAEFLGGPGGGQRRLLDAETALTPEGRPWLRPRGFIGAQAVGEFRTAAFVRTDVFTPVSAGSIGDPTGCPPTCVTLRLVQYPGDPDCSRELTFTAAHQSYSSPPARALGAQELTRLADRRDPRDRTARYPNGRPREALLILDTNSYPEPGLPGDVPIPRPADIEDRTHLTHRFTRTGTGEWVPDTHSDRTLRAAGLQDIARHLTENGRTGVLAPTTPGYADQGGERRACRIDRAYASDGILTAVEDFTVVDCSGLSDHHALLITLDRRRLAEALSLTA
ncbi:hypothetical protein [Streptomyces clavuligerus]|uniref:hypothetical protein n=1 Tax=Streptomyces clavuligerus TaxID=1901 RepID=UPI00020D9269|nr:hypothetical protein [Streptomyces clavuligerus]WDN55957.1 hypothetical protein LL058_29135 [Streptomyces clavuligerus]